MHKCTTQVCFGYIIQLNLLETPGDRKRNNILQLKGWVNVHFEYTAVQNS